ncbi:MAG TPA: hypothetical protein VLU43_09135 [Anaeromyxobacteraceae bacterium]|nr:hypothetical protein [Anaeromyxobacteraceae bacterium]
MSRWAGWGAGPAGAGSSGGPSRAFLGAMLAVAALTAASAAAGGRWLTAALLALAAIYFGLRLFGGLGRRAP